MRTVEMALLKQLLKVLFLFKISSAQIPFFKFYPLKVLLFLKKNIGSKSSFFKKISSSQSLLFKKYHPLKSFFLKKITP